MVLAEDTHARGEVARDQLEPLAPLPCSHLRNTEVARHHESVGVVTAQRDSARRQCLLEQRYCFLVATGFEVFGGRGVADRRIPQPRLRDGAEVLALRPLVP